MSGRASDQSRSTRIQSGAGTRLQSRRAFKDGYHFVISFQFQFIVAVEAMYATSLRPAISFFWGLTLLCCNLQPMNPKHVFFASRVPRRHCLHASYPIKTTGTGIPSEKSRMQGRCNCVGTWCRRVARRVAIYQLLASGVGAEAAAAPQASNPASRRASLARLTPVRPHPFTHHTASP